jgi:hypothetical protein
LQRTSQGPATSTPIQRSASPAPSPQVEDRRVDQGVPLAYFDEIPRPAASAGRPPLRTIRDGLVEVVDKTVPQLVVEAACALYGDQWRSDLARSLDLHPRTVRRIGSAAMVGEPYPISPGVLKELAAHARGRAAAMETVTFDGRSRARCFKMIAVELDEAVRVWTPTRRPRKAG